MYNALCPECDQLLTFTYQPALCEPVGCHSCGSPLRVLRVDPLKLDWAYQEPFDRTRVGKMKNPPGIQDGVGESRSSTTETRIIVKAP